MTEKIPENLITFAAHGGYEIPRILRSVIRREFDKRLQMNFSDFGVWELLSQIPENQKLRPQFGRTAGDGNRGPGAKDLFPEKDFGGLKIFNRKLTIFERGQMKRFNYFPFHREIIEKMLNPLVDGKIAFFDVHDTDNKILAKNPKNDHSRPNPMPPIVISSGGGLTAPAEFLEDVKMSFAHHFDLNPMEIDVDRYYKGGFVTKNYGDPNHFVWRNQPKSPIVQIELLRNYLNEKRTELVPKLIAHTREKLMRALADVADGLNPRIN